MSLYRDFAPITNFPANYVRALGQFISTGAFNFQLVRQSGTVVRIPAGTGNDQTGIGIYPTPAADGVAGWRWRTTNLDLAHPTDVAGTYDIFVTVSTANAFHSSGAGEIDDTDYNFNGVILPHNTTPTGVVAYRKVGETTWDGSQITSIYQIVNNSFDSRLPTQAENDALVGTSGVPSDANRFVTNTDARNSDPRTPTGGAGGDLAGGYPNPTVKPSVGLTGNPTAPTQVVTDASTRIATTAFVVSLASLGVTPQMDGVAAVGTSVRYSREDHKHPVDTSRAPVDSPTFTTAASAPTPPADDNDTSIATTAFVLGQLAGVAQGTPSMDGVAARGVSTRGARADHIHPVDTSRAPIDNPAFTTKTTAPYVGIGAGGWMGSSVPDNVSLYSNYSPVLTSWTDVTKPSWAASVGNASDRFVVFRAPPASTGFVEVMALTAAGALTVASFSGTPDFTGAATGQTAAPGDNTRKLATTAFVLANGASLSGAVPLMDGAAAVGTATNAARGDHRHPTDTSRAPVDSPTFTGAARAVTQGSSDNSTLLATTAYVKNQSYATTGFVTGQGYVVGGTHVAFSDVDVSGAIDATNIKSFGHTRFFSDALRTYVYDAAGVERLRVSGTGVLLNQASNYLAYTGWTFAINPGSGAQRNARYDNALGSVANILATLISDLKDQGVLGSP